MSRLLIVDDDHGTRETYRAALRHEGYEVNMADSGSAAIAALSEGLPPEAVVLDLNLGDMTGYEVLRWMRARSLAVPTAVITAFRADFEPDEAIALGAVAYADQPLSIDDILTLARTLTAPPSPRDDPLLLHRRFLAGHPGALDCLASIFLKSVTRRLTRAFPLAPRDFAIDATTDACLEYAARPSRFDLSRSQSIVRFLFLIARRNLSDRLRAEAALKRREARYVAEQAVNSGFNAVRYEIDIWACIVQVTNQPGERRAAQLWLDGATNDSIAQALGHSALPVQDRRLEVRRFKDRVLKRLSRRLMRTP